MKHITFSTLLFLALLLPQAAFSQVADDGMAIAQRAWQLQQAGDYAGAVDAYRAFLKIHPDEAAARSNLAVALVKLGRYDEAIAEYQKAEKLLSGDPRIRLNLALAYEKSGRLREACGKFDVLHSELLQNKQVTMLLADCELQLGENDRVIGLLQPLAQDDSSDLAVAYMLGTALVRQRRIQEGQVLIDRIMRSGDSAEGHFLLGTQLVEAGDYPAAVRELSAAVKLNPKLPQLQSYYGLALLNTGDPDAALTAFHNELTDHPNDYEANLGAGQILVARKQYSEALPLLERALLLHPASAEAMLGLGEALNGAGRLHEARARLAAATQALPRSLEAHRQLAEVYTRLHLISEAARERAVVNRLEQDVAATAEGPKLNEMASDFELADISARKKVRLSDFRGKTPVLLVFGSYSCPNFRSSAEALNDLFRRYGQQVAFFLIYIREAHATDNWQSTRNARSGIAVAPVKTMQDKEGHAAQCRLKLHLRFPTLVDGMDGRVESAYSAWPSRAFLIGINGRILYSTRLTELDFHAADLESALRKAIASSRKLLTNTSAN